MPVYFVKTMIGKLYLWFILEGHTTAVQGFWILRKHQNDQWCPLSTIRKISLADPILACQHTYWCNGTSSNGTNLIASFAQFLLCSVLQANWNTVKVYHISGNNAQWEFFLKLIQKIIMHSLGKTLERQPSGYRLSHTESIFCIWIP